MIKLEYNNDEQLSDLRRTDSLNLETDGGLQTAVTISLFSDARAADDDKLEAGVDARGWWGHSFLTGSRQLGSRLWLIQRSKASADTLNKAKSWAEEALQWLVDERVAETVTAKVEKLKADVLLLTIDIQRPSKTAPRWRGVWEVQLGL